LVIEKSVSREKWTQRGKGGNPRRRGRGGDSEGRQEGFGTRPAFAPEIRFEGEAYDRRKIKNPQSKGTIKT